jgi:hypothetical protein
MNRKLILGSCEISFEHEFELKDQFNSKTGLSKTIGLPRATNITIKHGDEEVSAKVSCSHKDTFKYETGRKLAIRKAFSQMSSISKEDKRRVWDEYNKLKVGGRW